MITHDAFLSYSTADREAVTALAETLSGRGIRVWLDQWELRPGDLIQPRIEEAIQSSKNFVIFVGPGSPGPWQEVEKQLAFAIQVGKENRIIPVILPGGPNVKEIQGFLRITRVVRFGDSIEDQAALADLVWGITGMKPERSSVAETEREPARTTLLTTGYEGDIRALGEALHTNNVTFFLGRGACAPGGPACLTDGEISRQLLLDLNFIDSGYAEILPPAEISASFYAVGHGDSSLEDRVGSYIDQRPRVVPLVHRRLADLLKVLSRRTERRIRRPTVPMVITTCIGLELELALFREGVAFTRVTQSRRPPGLEIAEFRGVGVASDNLISFTHEGAPPALVSRDDLEGLANQMQFFERRVVPSTTSNERAAAPSLADLTSPVQIPRLPGRRRQLHHFVRAVVRLRLEVPPARGCPG
jgi:hypothetical protein